MADSMSTFLPNTLIDVLRGEGTDEYGYPVDTDTVVQAGLPAFVTRHQARAVDAAAGRMVTVERFTVRLRPGAFTVQEADRLRATDGTIYLVTTVNAQHNPVLAADIVVTATRVS